MIADRVVNYAGPKAGAHCNTDVKCRNPWLYPDDNQEYGKILIISY